MGQSFGSAIIGLIVIALVYGSYFYYGEEISSLLEPYISENDDIVCSSGEIWCNGECWENTCENEPGRKFVCDSERGGLCEHETNNCEEANKISCNGQCWEKCPIGSEFVCDESGGKCVN